jgi:exodeoxyribonuclease VII large subunit
MAMQRRKTIDWLRREDLFDLNRSLPLPAVFQRIAVVTSQEAAGFQDFNTHLLQNIYGYRFQTNCFFAAVQGKNAENEICYALDLIAEQKNNFDAVVIVRGGGSRLDLSVFDALELCKKVAVMPLPVLAGVGHEADESVLDMVAHSALKTPTAVADFLIEHNLRFETALVNIAAQIHHLSDRQVRYASEAVKQIRSQILWSAQGILSFSNGILEKISADLPVLVQRRLHTERSRLLHSEQLATVFSPENTLRRGYSLTAKNGKIVKSADELLPGDLIETRLADGSVESQVALTRRPSS